jgi:hypothetical protein
MQKEYRRREKISQARLLCLGPGITRVKKARLTTELTATATEEPRTPTISARSASPHRNTREANSI